MKEVRVFECGALQASAPYAGFTKGVVVLFAANDFAGGRSGAIVIEFSLLFKVDCATL